MRRAIKGSLPSPAITELLLRRNYLGNETNLKLTACGEFDVYYMGTLSHMHSHTQFALLELAVSFPPTHLCTSVRVHVPTPTFKTNASTHACRDVPESDWSFWQLLVCLLGFIGLPLVFFHFIAPLLLRCVCVCVQALARFHTLKCSLTLWLLCGAGELWAVITLKCYLGDSYALWQRQSLSAVVPLCYGRWGWGRQLK